VSPRSPATPLVSVVTPLYNCLAHTRAMLDSLRDSMPRGITYEVILVDDGSTDGTREWLEGLREPYAVILNERNLGFGAATNRGASAARGRILALLNNDLVLRKGWIRPMLRALDSLGSRAGIVGNIQLDAATGEVDHAGIYFNRKCKPEHDRRDPGRAAALLFPIREMAAVTGACVLVRRETWRALGGFDESFVNGCEDMDLCFRARAAGLVNAVALRSRVLHHVSASPGRKLRDEENTHRLVERWHEQISLLGSWRWAWRYYRPFFGEDPRDVPDPFEAWDVALYLARVRRRPPAKAVAAMHGVIDRELARWRRLVSD
jgi:O-antigen biosynthesis protein